MLKHLRKFQSESKKFTKMRQCIDGAGKMEVQSKWGPKVGKAIRKNGGASKAMFL